MRNETINEALGMVETRGLATAVTAADIMVKTASVKLLGVERAKGQGWVTIKVTGDVAAVNAAVQAGIAVAETCGDYVASKVIPRPEEGVRELFMQPEQKFDWAEDYENATLAKLERKSDSSVEKSSDTDEKVKEIKEVKKTKANTVTKPVEEKSANKETQVKGTGVSTVKPKEENKVELADKKTEAAGTTVKSKTEDKTEIVKSSNAKAPVQKTVVKENVKDTSDKVNKDYSE